MPFAQVAAVSAGDNAFPLGSNKAVTAPAGIAAGNLLVAFVVQADRALGNPITQLTASTGWHKVFGRVFTSGANDYGETAAFARVADGGANDALSISGDVDAEYIAYIARITDHGVTNPTSLTSASATASSGQCDPPSLSPGSSADWLWLAIGGFFTPYNNATANVTADPANYTNRLYRKSTFRVANHFCFLRVASRELTAATENPGTFTHDPGGSWVIWMGGTVAIPYGASTTTVPGVAAVPLGALTVTATGHRQVHGVAAVPLGALTVTASGTVTAGPVTVTGAAAVPLGGLTVTATGKRTVTGVAAVPLGQLQVAAEGQRQIEGVAAVALGLMVLTAIGRRQVHGVATVNLGGLTVSAVVTIVGLELPGTSVGSIVSATSTGSVE